MGSIPNCRCNKDRDNNEVEFHKGDKLDCINSNLSNENTGEINPSKAKSGVNKIIGNNDNDFNEIKNMENLDINTYSNREILNDNNPVINTHTSVPEDKKAYHKKELSSDINMDLFNESQEINNNPSHNDFLIGMNKLILNKNKNDKIPFLKNFNYNNISEPTPPSSELVSYNHTVGSKMPLEIINEVNTSKVSLADNISPKGEIIYNLEEKIEYKEDEGNYNNYDNHDDNNIENEENYIKPPSAIDKNYHSENINFKDNLNNNENIYLSNRDSPPKSEKKIKNLRIAQNITSIVPETKLLNGFDGKKIFFI
jgi:hypothetical protein